MKDPKNNQPVETQFFNVKQVSEYLNIKVDFTRSLVFKRQIPVIRIGKSLRFNKNDIDHWLESKKYSCVEEN
jgi:excisionase family DNA binding protein